MKKHICAYLPVMASLLLISFPGCKSSGGKKYTIPGIITGSVEDPTGGFADTGTYLRDVHVSQTAGNDASGDGSPSNPYASLNKALSVAVQIVWFKLTRKRVFLMAPLHHHFEFLAWSETKIMLRFWIVAAVCAGLGFTLYQASVN